MIKSAIILVFCFSIMPRLKSQQILVFVNMGSGANNKSAALDNSYKNGSWSDSLSKTISGQTFEIKTICKGYKLGYITIAAATNMLDTIKDPKPVVQTQTQLLKVSGNILYDVNYRSRIDTPYAEKNIYQHTLQTRLDFIYKNEFPFKIYITTRFNNSSLFRKYTDLNFQYSPVEFKRIIVNKILEKAKSYILSRAKEIDSLKSLIEVNRATVSSLANRLQPQDISQKIVEERERKMFSSKNQKAEGNTLVFPDAGKLGMKNERSAFEVFSLHNTDRNISYEDSIGIQRKRLDSLEQELATEEKSYRDKKAAQQNSLGQVRQDLETSNNISSLTKNLRKWDIPDTALPKGYKNLFAIQSLSIGRSIANYSELSVKNVNITGVQVEYNPQNYFAFAIGKVDFRYRDYIITDKIQSNQYLALVRYGRGLKDGSHWIVTYYTGRRQFFNSSIATQPNNSIPEYNLGGISFEGVYNISRNVSLVGEIAKSTTPYYSMDSLQRKNWMKSISKLKDRSNEAYAFKFNSYITKTQTKLTAGLKYLGPNFQSFSTFTTGSSQLKWDAKMEQWLFKKKLNITSSLIQNDYNNPFVTTAYNSSSLLASFQARFRKAKWPTLSIGYYPSYQLTKINDNNYSETRYYSLVSNGCYYYHIHKTQFSSCVLFSQFFNSSADSGFVYFNSKNLMVSQTVAFNKLSILSSTTVYATSDYKIYNVENGGQLIVSKLLTIGGGVKIIKHTLFKQAQWGYSGNLILRIPYFGDIQMVMDKGYIPGTDRRLVENSMGRLTYFQTF